MQENEFRVRPVTRYNVTHYLSDGRSGSCSSLGEFDSLEAAERVAKVMHLSQPGSTYATVMESGSAPHLTQPSDGALFAIIGVNTFEVDNKAYFAYSEQEAEQTRIRAEQEHGGRFRVYRR